MTETFEVRRNAKGVIDYDHYRAEAVTLRRKTMQDAASRIPAPGFGLFRVAACVSLAFAVIVIAVA